MILFLLLLGLPSLPLLVIVPLFYTACGREMAVALLVMCSASLVTVSSVLLLLARAAHHSGRDNHEAADVNKAGAMCVAAAGLVVWLVSAILAANFLFQYTTTCKDEQPTLYFAALVWFIFSVGFTFLLGLLGCITKCIATLAMAAGSEAVWDADDKGIGPFSPGSPRNSKDTSNDNFHIPHSSGLAIVPGTGLAPMKITFRNSDGLITDSSPAHSAVNKAAQDAQSQSLPENVNVHVSSSSSSSLADDDNQHSSAEESSYSEHPLDHPSASLDAWSRPTRPTRPTRSTRPTPKSQSRRQPKQPVTRSSSFNP